MQLVPAVTIARAAAGIDTVKLVNDQDIADQFIGNPACVELLTNYLLFTHRPDIFEPLSAHDRIYNRYYWFMRLVNLHKSLNGPDAGLDQQAFQIIESADCDLDWSIIKNVESMAQPGDDP